MYVSVVKSLSLSCSCSPVPPSIPFHLLKTLAASVSQMRVNFAFHSTRHQGHTEDTNVIPPSPPPLILGTASLNKRPLTCVEDHSLRRCLYSGPGKCMSLTIADTVATTQGHMTTSTSGEVGEESASINIPVIPTLGLLTTILP